ncbi:hypothetical protein [Cognatiyoonia sp. IB215182]|uniref:hypothetical protein n=1 Tax=Cognatiyoonia sp. IB215182 TaxID=3097353 RepID=UPI002A10FF6A|nr:hypothetical protein [Cognatiyoonia sp. IB215182]MDX8351700.1 hypothetical protein [Cognatiyoonia sp. IB215182]
MGREAIAVCHWQGEVAEAKLHLDSKMLSLRGEMRVDIPRDDIRDVVLRDDGLQVVTPGPVLFMEFSQKDAGLWQKALLKKPPTLAEKLGVSAEKPAFVQGSFDDAPLAEALAGATVPAPDEASILLAIVMTLSDLEAASDLALAHPDRHIWMVYRKGKAAEVGDTIIRAHMRDRGFIDSKTSAVSDQLTTTRYRFRAK